MNTNAAGKPVLSLKANGLENYTASPGETVLITYEISGGSEWSTSGIHFNYDARLIPDGDNEGNIYYSLGDAVSDMDMVQVWQRTGNDIHDNPPAAGSDIVDISPYVSRSQNCVFIITFSKENTGHDGTVAQINITVPEDAQPGDKYDLNFWNLKSDLFTDKNSDSAMQEYAFSNFQNCSITVKENTSSLKGDATLDGKIDSADVVAVAAYVGNPDKNPLDSSQISNSDVHNTGDGLTANDSLMIQQYLAKIVTKFE